MTLTCGPSAIGDFTGDKPLAFDSLLFIGGLTPNHQPGEDAEFDGDAVRARRHPRFSAILAAIR